MSAKIISSISDEKKQDFHKQYGCMNGIFQLFDRHYFITGKRIATINKSLLPVSVSVSVSGTELGTESKTVTVNPTVGEVAVESKTTTANVPPEKSVKIVEDEPQITTVESPRKSPSSRSLLMRQVNHLDHPTQVPKKQTNLSSCSNNHRANKTVKNSIHEEHSGLSVKTAVKEKGGSHTMKHVDSPRPLLSKPSYSRITGFDSSPRSLTKIQVGPRTSMEQKGNKNDLPRFSLDGRETRDTDKSVTKFKDCPRFSLDSRKSSLSESRLNLLKELTRDNNINQTISARPANVVVRLMGLEAFPDPNSDHPSFDHEFECSRYDVSLIEPSSTSRFLIEQSPWKHSNKSNRPPKKAQNFLNVCREAKIASSVYGEMEEKLNELEFTKYGKDLRALKQILEEMQKKQQEQQSDSEPQTSSCSTPSKALISRRNRSDKLTQTKDQNSPKRFDSPKTIAKKPGPLDTSNLLKSKNRQDLVIKMALQDETPKNSSRSLAYKKNMNNALKPVQTSKALPKAENCTAISRNSAALSPRFHSNHQRTRNHSRKSTESDKSSKKTRRNQTLSTRKPCSYNDIRSFTSLDDSSSLQSDTNSSTSQISITDTPAENTPNRHIHSKERHIAARLYEEDKQLAELTITTERPSPISVLDATFCLEDSPSPVKKISISFQDFETPDSDKVDLRSLNISSGISRSGDKREHEQAKHLIHTTRFPAVMPDTESWDLYGNPNRNSNIKYDYIAEILSASGLLKNMGPNHIEKFTRNQKIHRKMLFDTVNEIISRKMASESPLMLQKRIKTEQELLREIFVDINNLQSKIDYCSDDLDGLGNILTVDMNQQPDDWADMQSEVPAMVLDIERLIFKDLITEVLNDMRLDLHDIPGKQRKLFF